MSKLPSCDWYAADKPSRVALISKNTDKLVSQVGARLKIHAGDSSKTDFENEFFDGILLDAPCSATGSRPKPVVKNVSDRQVKSYQKLQRKLFHEAHRILKSGGCLVFRAWTRKYPFE